MSMFRYTVDENNIVNGFYDDYPNEPERNKPGSVAITKEKWEECTAALGNHKILRLVGEDIIAEDPEPNPLIPADALYRSVNQEYEQIVAEGVNINVVGTEYNYSLDRDYIVDLALWTIFTTSGTAKCDVDCTNLQGEKVVVEHTITELKDVLAVLVGENKSVYQRKLDMLTKIKTAVVQKDITGLESMDVKIRRKGSMGNEISKSS